MMSVRFMSCAIALAAAVAVPGHAQSYPTKTIRLVVPLAPGGPSDILARTMAAKLTESLKQTVVVDNRPGAGGTLGADIVAKAPPDGYTMLLMGVSTLTINASMYSKLSYDTLRDFTAISVLAGAPYLLVVHPSLPVKSLNDLVALAKARPGELNYASGGTGTGPHLAMEVLKDKLHMKIEHIPYKGAGPAMNDLIAGHVQVLMVNMIAGLPMVKAGRMRALGQSGARRSPGAPDIPTFAEGGAAGYDSTGQHGMWFPAGVPRDIVMRVNEDIVKALHTKDVSERLAAEGAEVVGNTPDEAQAIVRRDVAQWAAVIKKLGLKPN
jgi:tripartite-type tricarboxylate transporter receptor subunit TctC